MTRRDFFRRLLPSTECLEQEDKTVVQENPSSMRELFLQAMAIGLDPASFSPEELRARLAARAHLQQSGDV